jgi:putative Holliday junction resolvase
MKLLAVDYGEKRVGIASTDDSGEFAIPRMVIENSENLIKEISELIYEWKIEKVILGESKKYDGSKNIISSEIEKFKLALESQGIEVIFHPELLTTMEAERIQGKNEFRDASAAALILKSYIDTQNNDFNRSI